MVLVTNGWDGVWASLVGGVISGVTVVIGVVLAQRLADSRARVQAERDQANALLVEVGNTRDAAVRSRSKGPTGRYDLWQLRHQIHLSYALRGKPVLLAVDRFYSAVWAFREWVRHEAPADGNWSETQVAPHAYDEYRRALDVWAEALIDALKDPDEQLTRLASHGPDRPELPS